jgi:hypothetical protein
MGGGPLVADSSLRRWRCAVPRPPPPSPSPDAVSTSYTNLEGGGPTAGMQYTLSTEPATFAAARQACQEQPGGDLVVYDSLAEQMEVETSFTQAGVLNPQAYRSYWLGMWIPSQLVSAWPGFKPVLKQGNGSSYANWGTLQPGARKEPNGLTGPELCAVANYSQALRGAWGWSDVPCALKTASICKIREWAERPPRRLGASESCHTRQQHLRSNRANGACRRRLLQARPRRPRPCRPPPRRCPRRCCRRHHRAPRHRQARRRPCLPRPGRRPRPAPTRPGRRRPRRAPRLPTHPRRRRHPLGPGPRPTEPQP